MYDDASRRSGGRREPVHVSEVIEDALDYSGPTYQPPYDSPLEDRFARRVVKYLHSDVEMEPQLEAATPWGVFRIDFGLTRGNLCVGIECDGKAFHSGEAAERDDWRDAAILGRGSVDAIYRIRGTDLYQHPRDLLYLLSQRDPVLFSERGQTNLTRLATIDDDSRPVRRLARYGMTMVPYRQEDPPEISHLHLRRHHLPSADEADRYEHGYLLSLLNFARSYGEAPLEEVRAAFWEMVEAA